jgi:hypothetical protein
MAKASVNLQSSATNYGVLSFVKVSLLDDSCQANEDEDYAAEA